MAPYSSTLAWKIPWTEEPGGLQSMGSRRVGHGLSNFTFTFHFHALEKAMATHSSVLACGIPGTGEPGGLPSMGLHRIGHNWRNLAAKVLPWVTWFFQTASNQFRTDFVIKWDMNYLFVIVEWTRVVYEQLLAKFQRTISSQFAY